MGLFFPFESAFIATIMVGEPMVVLAILIACNLVYERIVDDSVFFLFLGALCATMGAKTMGWKPVGDNLFSNVVKAAFMLCLTVVFLPLFGPSAIRVVGAYTLYFLQTQRLEIPGFLFCINLLVGFYPQEDQLGALTVVTFVLSVLFYVNIKLKCI